MKVWTARGSLLSWCLGVIVACGTADRRHRAHESDDAGEGGSEQAGSAGTVAAPGGNAGSNSSGSTSGTSGSPESGTGGLGAAGNGASAGMSEAGGEPGSGGSSETGGSTGTSGSSSEGGTSGAAGAGDTCTGDAPSVLFLIDTSRSNADPNPGGNDAKWPIARDVLMTAFEELPSTLRAGLLFFPQVSSSMMPPCFEVNDEIPIAPYGVMQRQAFLDALQNVVPDGGTPTYDAYDYVTQELTALDPAGPRVIVLVTDGVPNYLPECNGDAVEDVEWEGLVAMVEAANDTGIHTLAVASPDSSQTYPMLSAIATAGGNLGVCNDTSTDGCFFDMSVSTDLGSWLVESLAGLTEECAP